MNGSYGDERARAETTQATREAGGAVTPAVNRTPVLRARGVTKVYRMGEVEVHALRGVDLDLLDGELLAILGPSGSGKSTLLNVFGGLDALHTEPVNHSA